MSAGEFYSKIKRSHPSVPSEKLHKVGWLTKSHLCSNCFHRKAGVRKQAFRFQDQALLYYCFGCGTARHYASSAERLRRTSDSFRIVLNAPRLREIRVDGSTEFLERPAMIVPDGGRVALDVMACDCQEHCIEEVLESNG
jgi:hypothetical protein